MAFPIKFLMSELVHYHTPALYHQQVHTDLLNSGIGSHVRSNFLKHPMHFFSSTLSINRYNTLNSHQIQPSKNTSGRNKGSQLSASLALRRAPPLVASLQSQGHSTRRPQTPNNLVDLFEQMGYLQGFNSTWLLWKPPTFASHVKTHATSTPSSSIVPPQQVAPTFTFSTMPPLETLAPSHHVLAPSVEVVVDQLLEKLPTKTIAISDLLTTKQRCNREKNMCSCLKEKAQEHSSQDRSAFTWVGVVVVEPIQNNPTFGGISPSTKNNRWIRILPIT